MGRIAPDSCCVNMRGIRWFSLDPFARELRVWGGAELACQDVPYLAVGLAWSIGLPLSRLA